MYLLDKFIELIPQIIPGLLVLVPFFIAWVLSKLLFSKLKKKDKSRSPVIVFFAKTTNVIIITMAIITVLGTWGFDVSALLTGLGLTGFALGFALQDVLSSCIAGMLILFYRPFQLHSKISTMEVEGEVIDIDMRYTTLQSGGKKHLIPNSKLISKRITVLDSGSD